MDSKGLKVRQRLPSWFKIRLRRGEEFKRVESLLRAHGLNTVCEGAGCPNKWECWNAGTATFMILGDVCTRGCNFCSVKKGAPVSMEMDEAVRVASAVASLNLKHVVVTSVTRDDLGDGGASLFCRTAEEIRKALPHCGVEVLVPDFKGDLGAVKTVVDSAPTVFAHNLETVSSLYPKVRPQADYNRSLKILKTAREWGRGVMIKSGLILGFGGETEDSIHRTMEDLVNVGCHILTIGQYLRPSKACLSVERFYLPEEFEGFKKAGMEMGFSHVESGPLVRSSYHAGSYSS